jgi:hypothetical protein
MPTPETALPLGRLDVSDFWFDQARARLQLQFGGGFAKLTEPWSQRALKDFTLPDGSPWPSPHQQAVWGASFAYLGS